MVASYLTDQEQAAGKGMIVAYHSHSNPERMAIQSEQGSRTYKQLNNRINQISRALTNFGIRQGDAVSLLCSNRPEFAEVLMACFRTGIRISPINWHLTANEVSYIVNDSESVALFGDARFATNVEIILQECPKLKLPISIGGEIPGCQNLDDLISGESTENIDNPRLGQQMLYTSGTTGSPKGVYREPTSSTAGLSPLFAAAGYDAGSDTSLCTGPLYHAAPLGLDLLAALGAGTGIYLMDKWDPEKTLRLIHDYKITQSHMVPTMFHRLLALPEEIKRKYDVSSLKFLIHGAAPCPVHVKEAMFSWFGPIIYEYYGATEGTGTFVGPDIWSKRPGTVGIATEGLIIVDEDSDEEMPIGEVGIIWLPVPTEGKFQYFKAEEKTAGAYRNGTHFSMHDMGYVDEDGFLFLSDRRADLILSGGVNVYPAEVDACLLQHPDVSDVCTIGIPSESWGQSVMSVVELKQNIIASDELKASLIEHCVSRIAKFKCPRSIEFGQNLPRTEAGKIQRYKVRQTYVPESA
ncbi:MAG: AMP-binding protein [Pseudomonadales bacterium]|nr:AMP-binding protein [Pseudomonadales bacterium]